VHELDIAAVMYGSKCIGMDYAAMHPKITTEPMRTLLAQALIPVKEIRAPHLDHAWTQSPTCPWGYWRLL
jgi:hypothetical protein